MEKVYDVVVIGAGAVGCAIARELSKYKLKVAVLEKGRDVASMTSGSNSAVVHAGFNNIPNTLMAKFCVKGNEMFESLSKELGFSYRKSGKLLIAFDEDDEKTLSHLYEQGLENGCKGLELIDKSRLEELVPNIGGISGLYSSNTAIFNPFQYAVALAENAFDNGVEFFFSNKVIAANQHVDQLEVITTQNTFYAKSVVNASGLFSAEISSLFGVDGYKIYPCRGEYLILDTDENNILPLPIYPAPKKGQGGLGVHLTPTTDGNIIVGPSAEYIHDNDCSTTESVQKKLEKEALELLPSVGSCSIIGSYSGIRPKQTKPGEGGFRDFTIKIEEECKRLVNLIGIESPGLTASYAIAQMVSEELLPQIISMERKDVFIPARKRDIPFRELSDEEQAKKILEDQEWGDIICRCRVVSKHEIRAAIENPLGVRTLSAIKYRAWPMTGRCNGGYCLQKITQMLIDEYGMEESGILYKNDGSNMFVGKVKRMKYYDVIIVGGGPGGIAAAKGAYEKGAKKILLIEREKELGGVLNQCIHDGFGLIRYNEQLSGPEYAIRVIDEVLETGIEVKTEAIVTSITSDRHLFFISKEGLSEVKAGSIVLATGCRERTRGMVRIPGSRPAGIFTAGVVQNLVNVRNVMVGRKIAILGSGDIGLIMARRLFLEGADVIAVIEMKDAPSGLKRNVSQCLYDFDIPLYLAHSVTRIIGGNRLEAIEIAQVDSKGMPMEATKRILEVDTLVLSVGLIPENEVAKKAGVSIDVNGGVETDCFLQTSIPGIFSAGNSRKIMDLVDYVSMQGEVAGRNAASYVLNTDKEEWSDISVEFDNKGLPDKDSIVCTNCPKGCQIKVSKENEVIGYKCRRGKAFAIAERVSPERILTTTIRVLNGNIPLLPIRSVSPVKKDEMLNIISILSKMKVYAPIEVGQTIVCDIGKNKVSFIAEKRINLKKE